MSFCKNFIITNPTALAVGEYYQINYKLQANNIWLTLLPNPTLQSFKICGLQSGVYNIKVRRVKANGEPCQYAYTTFVIYNTIDGNPPNGGNGIPFSVNYTTAQPQSNFCFSGGQFTRTVYTNGALIVPSTQLYADVALTVPLGQGWVRENNSQQIFSVDAIGRVSANSTLNCPI